MLGDTVNNISELIGINQNILPNIITFFVVVILLITTLRSQLSLTVVLMIYGVAMAILSLLGIDSVFNIFTLVESVIDEVVDLVI